MSNRLHCWNCKGWVDSLIEEEVEGMTYYLCGNRLKIIDPGMECRAAIKPERKRYCPRCKENVNLFLIDYEGRSGYWGEQFICGKCGEPSWGIKSAIMEEEKKMKRILLPGSKQYEDVIRDL